MKELHFHPPLWRRVRGPLLASILFGAMLFVGLVDDQDLRIFGVRGSLVGVLLSALVVVVWLYRNGQIKAEAVSLLGDQLRLQHGGKVDTVPWAEVVSLWVNQQGKILVVNLQSGSSIHANLGTFSEGDLAEIERLARERHEAARGRATSR
ncbi:MAG: hypothetical protein MUF64_10380 [Polyangiaceae bacterium]|jgi:hypothetical protein|nr:hypothetical protein [Polyangiaceae bacterium]